MPEINSDAEVIVNTAAIASGHHPVIIDGYTMGFLHAKGSTFVSAEELNDTPTHRKAHITLATFDSFRDYVLHYHAPDHSIIYADPAKRQLTCVFDDYPKIDEVASWRFHRALLNLQTSPELNDWKRLTEYVSQDAFAEFLNLHASQITAPAAADILEIVTQFEAVEEGRLTSKTRARDGRVQFAFEREAKVLSVDIPGELRLYIPLFAFAPSVNLVAQIRFRIRDRGLHFCLVFPDLADQLKHSWTLMLAELIAALPEGSLVVEGQP